jgi:beta-mannosidase
VVSDKLQPLSGQIHWRLLDFYGKVLTEKTQDVQVPAQSSAVYFTLDEKELLANADPKKSFLVFELAVGGQNVSRNLIFFDTMHNIDLPQFGVSNEVNGPNMRTTFSNSPRIGTALENSNGTYVVTLQSRVLARNIYLSFGDLDVQTADNYFDLLPGEPVTVKLKTSSSVSIDQLNSAMKVISLTDAFPAAPTMH